MCEFCVFFADIPFFQAHGEVDTILPLHHGVSTSKILKQFLQQHEVSASFVDWLMGKPPFL